MHVRVCVHVHVHVRVRVRVVVFVSVSFFSVSWLAECNIPCWESTLSSNAAISAMLSEPTTVLELLTLCRAG